MGQGPAPHFHDPRRRTRKRLAVAFGFTATLFLVELVGGFLSNSLALLSDAGHMLADLVALALTLLSIYWADKPATEQKTYGYYRLEVLVTLVNGALLLYVALQLAFEGTGRFFHPEVVNVGLMLPIASAGLLVNLLCFFVLRTERELLVTRSAIYHVFSDMVSSIGVLAGGVVIRVTGWTRADTLASIFVASLIFVNAFKLLRETYNILMEASPAHISLPEVQTAICETDGVEGVEDLHVWSIGSSYYALSAHILVRDMQTTESEKLIERVAVRLEELFQITHTTLQVISTPGTAQNRCLR